MKDVIQLPQMALRTLPDTTVYGMILLYRDWDMTLSCAVHFLMSCACDHGLLEIIWWFCYESYLGWGPTGVHHTGGC